jgi:hypothetical protein
VSRNIFIVDLIFNMNLDNNINNMLSIDFNISMIFNIVCSFSEQVSRAYIFQHILQSVTQIHT